MGERKLTVYIVESCRPASEKGSCYRVHREKDFKMDHLHPSTTGALRVEAKNEAEMVALLIEHICGLDVPVRKYLK